MRIEEFLARHGLELDPFANAEEAQGDDVLVRLYKNKTFQFGHPEWPKFCGHPPGNQSSIVFGFKGSGKTAMRLALQEAIDRHNQTAPADRTLLVPYDDFNAVLSNWRSRAQRSVSKRRHDDGDGWDSGGVSFRDHWTLAHHLDAMMAQITRALTDGARQTPDPAAWDEHIRYDLLFLASIYLTERTLDYRRAIRSLHSHLFTPWWRRRAKMRRTTANVASLGAYPLYRSLHSGAMARRIRRLVHVVEHDTSLLRWALNHIPPRYLDAQPLLGDGVDPVNESARFETLEKLLRIARAAGFARVAVVIDKVDEPTMVSGDYERMADFVLPLWNNKVLQTSGIHLKMLLPAQLYERIRKGDTRLLNTARLDKANIIYPLTWSGEHLYEMLSERAAACLKTSAGATFELHQLFDSGVTRDLLIQELAKMKLPRHASKFIHRCLCEAASSILPGDVGEDELPTVPSRVFYRISERFEAEMEQYTRDMQEF